MKKVDYYSPMLKRISYIFTVGFHQKISILIFLFGSSEMLHTTQVNISVGRGLFERVMLCTVSTVPCCLFLFANGTMLFTLRSKSVFREMSRYILLYNLLCADTVGLAVSQLLYLVAAFRIRLTYPVCGVIVMLAVATTVISPLTLLLMSLERYVAVCCPLRYSSIVTIRNTAVAIFVVWTFSSLNVVTHIVLLIHFPFDSLQNLQMKHFCSKENLLLSPVSALYDKAYTYFLFISAGVVVAWSYIGVMIAARSASTDKDSASKARNTLLLHLVQLGLSLSSILHNPMLVAMSTAMDTVQLVRIHIVLYICMTILPRCLCCLIYGIRDQTIRPILVSNLCCQWKHSLSITS